MSGHSKPDELEDETATPSPSKLAKLAEVKVEKIDDIEPESHIDHPIGSTMDPGDALESPRGVYKIVKKIGSGAFGEVYLTDYMAKNAPNSEQVALKKISLHGMGEKKKEKCKKEVKVMEQISKSPTNQHIAKYLDSFMITETKSPSHESLYIAMDYCSRGDLSRKIKVNVRSERQFDPKIIYDYIYQIADGINELHIKHKIVHRDLKPANILISWENGKEVLKISDFGLAKVIDSLNKSLSHTKERSTPLYMSPEQDALTPCRFVVVVDIWAIDIIFYELCIAPKKLTNEIEDLWEKVMNGQRIDLPSRYSEADTIWLNKMIAKDPSERMSANQVRDEARRRMIPATKIVNVCVDYLKLGARVFPDQKDVYDGFGLARNFLKDVLSTILKAPSPMKENSNQLNKLSGKINEVDQNNERRINELKALIGEHDFIQDIVAPVNILTKLMKTVWNYNTNESFDNFCAQCDSTPPYILVSRILELLRNDSTNPLIPAMNADKLRTTKTFRNWSDIFETLLRKLILIHIFHYDITRRTNKIGIDGVDPMAKALKDATKFLDNYIKNYDNDYWPNCVKKLIEKTADENIHVTNNAKANIIKEALMKIYTTDVFYIIVYDDVLGYHMHALSGSEYIHQFRRGRCNIVVNRSRRKVDNETYEAMKNSVEELRHISIKTSDSWYNSLLPGYNSLLPGCKEVFNAIPNSEFVGLIAESANPVIHSANSFNQSWEPCWWTTTKCMYYRRQAGGNEILTFEKNVILIVGFE